jgi:hypothetical protein
MLYENLETIQELAERWRVPLSWLYSKTRQRGKNSIPAVRMGKYIRFRPGERWTAGSENKMKKAVKDKDRILVWLLTELNPAALRVRV